MPTSTMFTPVDTFLFAFCVRFWAAAPAEGYFRVEFVAEPDFSCFGAPWRAGFSFFSSCDSSSSVSILPNGAGLLTGFYLFHDALVVFSAYLV